MGHLTKAKKINLVLKVFGALCLMDIGLIATLYYQTGNLNISIEVGVIIFMFYSLMTMLFLYSCFKEN
jgi:hypothetical protein